MNMPRTMKVSDYFATVLVLVALLAVGFFLVQTVSRINDGQRAVVCILGINLEDRSQAIVDACLADNGL